MNLKRCLLFTALLIPLMLLACDLPLGLKTCSPQGPCREGWTCNNSGICEIDGKNALVFETIDNRLLGWTRLGAGLDIAVLPTYEGGQDVLKMSSPGCAGLIGPLVKLQDGNTISIRVHFPQITKTPESCYAILVGAIDVGLTNLPTEPFCSGTNGLVSNEKVMWAVTLRVGNNCGAPDPTMAAYPPGTPNTTLSLPTSKGWHLIQTKVLTNRIQVKHIDESTILKTATFNPSDRVRLFVGFSPSGEIKTAHINYIHIAP